MYPVSEAPLKIKKYGAILIVIAFCFIISIIATCMRFSGDWTEEEFSIILGRLSITFLIAVFQILAVYGIMARSRVCLVFYVAITVVAVIMLFKYAQFSFQSVAVTILNIIGIAIVLLTVCRPYCFRQDLAPEEIPKMMPSADVAPKSDQSDE